MATLEGVVEAGEGIRLDRYLSETLGALSRSQLKARSGDICVNGKPAKLSRIVERGDRYRVVLADQDSHEEGAEDLPLTVLHEDSTVIVLDKAQGMVTHPAHGNWHGTVANGLLGRFRGNAPLEGGAPARAGIVHRLDKDTSGVLIAAKTAEAQEFLCAQFRARSTRKLYLAVVQGCPAAMEGRLDTWMGRDPRDRKRFCVSEEGTGKHAVTDWKLLGSAAGYALLLLSPKTGRTHQLRVHCRHLGYPIVGDPVYGRKDKRFPEATLMLHARELRIILPGKAEPSRFVAALPERFRTMLAALGLAVSGS